MADAPLPRTTAQQRRRHQTKASSQKSFLRYRTGSGILAIAAAKLGFQPVHAFDFDGNAVEIARENARMNKIAGKIRFWSGEVAELPMRPPRKYYLIPRQPISLPPPTERRRVVAHNLGSCRTLVVLAGNLKLTFRKWGVLTFGPKMLSSKTEKGWRSGSFLPGRKII